MSLDKSLLENIRSLSELLESVAHKIDALSRHIESEFPPEWIITIKPEPPYALKDAINGRAYKTKAAASSLRGNPGLDGTVVRLTDR